MHVKRTSWFLTQPMDFQKLLLKKDETLLLELALRGYDLSKLRDNESKVEIVKIG